ncbi:MAG: DUF1593 domain-containing protein [Clostridia bacterium]|nr:DUF1593 domain-containing protein [Clostridia bacterium]
MLKKPRTILTTDMECDDMNSLIHLFLYLNELELEGIVYTSSQYHFNGDGIHTLGEVTPHFCCLGPAETEGPMAERKPDPRAKDLMSYRPFEVGWIENLIRHEYAAAYPTLADNAEGFPTPEELLSRVYYGNYWFEGDVRFESEGSRLIERCIMDDREDVLYLQSWGGVNTIVRALLSIWEKHAGEPDWPEIRARVVRKTAILGVFGGEGQDNSFLDADIPGKYPGIRCLLSDFGYASFLTAQNGQEDVLPMMRADYMYTHFKTGHGPLMAKYALYGDGTVFRGECDRFQYGLLPVLDWGFGGMPPVRFEKYDMLGEGDSGTYIPLFTHFGLRGLEDWRYGTMLGILRVDDLRPRDLGVSIAAMGQRARRKNPFLKAYHEDFAARADWCVKGFAEANHNPVVTLSTCDLEAAPGEKVNVEGQVSDVRPWRAKWWLYRDGSRYEGARVPERGLTDDGTRLRFTVPDDARPGDFFNLILEVRNEHATPMTGYGQLILKVK